MNAKVQLWLRSVVEAVVACIYITLFKVGVISVARDCFPERENESEWKRNSIVFVSRLDKMTVQSEILLSNNL